MSSRIMRGSPEISVTFRGVPAVEALYGIPPHLLQRKPLDSRFAHFLDQFQTLPYNSLIFGTLIQPDGNSTVHGWVQGAKQAKSRRTVNFKKLFYFKYLPNAYNRRKNERTVRKSVARQRIETTGGNRFAAKS